MPWNPTIVSLKSDACVGFSRASRTPACRTNVRSRSCPSGRNGGGDRGCAYSFAAEDQRRRVARRAGLEHCTEGLQHDAVLRVLSDEAQTGQRPQHAAERRRMCAGDGCEFLSTLRPRRQMVSQFQRRKQIGQARDQLSQENLRDLRFGRRIFGSRRNGVGHGGFSEWNEQMKLYFFTFRNAFERCSDRFACFTRYAAPAVNTTGTPRVMTSVFSWWVPAAVLCAQRPSVARSCTALGVPALIIGSIVSTRPSVSTSRCDASYQFGTSRRLVNRAAHAVAAQTATTENPCRRTSRSTARPISFTRIARPRHRSASERRLRHTPTRRCAVGVARYPR